MQVDKILLLRVGVLVVSVCGLHAYLWATAVSMQLQSTRTPAEVLINTTVKRAHTQVYDSLKEPVLVSDAIGELQRPKHQQLSLGLQCLLLNRVHCSISRRPSPG